MTISECTNINYLVQGSASQTLMFLSPLPEFGEGLGGGVISS